MVADFGKGNTLMVVRDNGSINMLPYNYSTSKIPVEDIIGYVSPTTHDSPWPLTITKNSVYDWTEGWDRLVDIDKTMFPDSFIQKLIAVRTPHDITDVKFADKVSKFLTEYTDWS